MQCFSDQQRKQDIIIIQNKIARELTTLRYRKGKFCTISTLSLQMCNLLQNKRRSASLFSQVNISKSYALFISPFHQIIIITYFLWKAFLQIISAFFLLLSYSPLFTLAQDFLSFFFALYYIRLLSFPLFPSTILYTQTTTNVTHRFWKYCCYSKDY